ncbi:capping complex subunit for YIEGIA [Cohnella nanjingensis]|uniref:Uncharacterized protein n=1 Tax=Cohnella nanjingensis TaxID=1387779 RepID=A0A7X0RUY5_9BACL|nr:hypothetical protein [Cohnella nanjingensis]MBB6674163.1 hypothetical protein [Cohnella nanjingensis]
MAKIVAVFTSERQEVAGGAPIFIADDPAELQRLANLAEKILDCNAHQLTEGLYIIVDHRASE